MGKKKGPSHPLSQSSIVKGNNLSANLQIASELWTYFLNEYVNYLCIDFYCVGTMGNVLRNVCTGACRQTSLMFHLETARNIAYAESSRLSI